MPIDALAYEPQFIDHLASVWLALPERGTFYTEPDLVEFARSRNIEAEGRPIDLRLPFKGKPERKALVASYGDMKRARRVGYGNFARLEHGIGQSYSSRHPSYAGGVDHNDVTLFLMPNRHSAERWQLAYPSAQVEIVGSPRLDRIPARELGPVTVALSWHWRCEVAPETHPAFPYYARSLPDLARRYNLIGHGHPRILSVLEPYYVKAGIEVVRDFDEVCRRADVYVCDNSSTMYEFAASGRPVVTLNAPEYRRYVYHGLRFWEAIPGDMVDEPSELEAVIESALADSAYLRDVRERALDVVYAFRSGAAQRASERLAEWAVEKVAA